MRINTKSKAVSRRIPAVSLALTLLLSFPSADAASVCTVNASKLNVRAQPTTNSAVLTTVKRGTELPLIETESNGWLKVEVNGTVGYVSGDYATIGTAEATAKQSPSTTTVTGAQTGVVIADKLNVRGSPSTSAKILGTVKNGTTLTVTAQSGDWLQINFGSGAAYVSAAYVRLDSKASASAPTSTSTSSSSPSAAISGITVLKKGSAGDAVKALQQRLIALGYLSGGADGIFGPATKSAVTAFQHANGLAADGIAGAYTLAALKNGSPAATTAAKPAQSAGQSASAATTSSKSTANYSSQLASQAIEATNAIRARYGLAALSTDSDLMAAAQIRAAELALVFDHTRPDGSACSTVSNKVSGENIASGYSSGQAVVNAWMDSTSHRDNILSDDFASIGIACAQINGTYYWVQLFGR